MPGLAFSTNGDLHQKDALQGYPLLFSFLDTLFLNIMFGKI